MDYAIEEAKMGLYLNEVPVGAVIVKDDKIIASAYNLRETLRDPTAHAEVLAIRKAAAYLGDWRLKDCDMYVTLEPCPMCAGTIVQARLRKLYIGTFDPVAGACGSVINVIHNENWNHYVDVKWEYDESCSAMLEEFFRGKR